MTQPQKTHFIVSATFCLLQMSDQFHMREEAQGTNTRSRTSLGAILETGLQTTGIKIRVPCHLQRYFQLKAPQLIITGQGQKLISLLSSDNQPGSGSDNWGKYSKKTGEDKRRRRKQRKSAVTYLVDRIDWYLGHIGLGTYDIPLSAFLRSPGSGGGGVWMG